MGWKEQQTRQQKTVNVTVGLGNQAFPQDCEEETSVLTGTCWRSLSAGQPAGCRTPWDRQVTFFRVMGPVPMVSLLTHHLLQPLSHAECAASQSPTARQGQIFQCSAATERCTDILTKCNCSLRKTYFVLFALAFGFTHILGFWGLYLVRFSYIHGSCLYSWCFLIISLLYSIICYLVLWHANSCKIETGTSKQIILKGNNF